MTFPESGGIAMNLTDRRVAVLLEQQYQELEVWYPVYRLKEAGAAVTFVAPEAGKTYPASSATRRNLTWPRKMWRPQTSTRS